MFSRFEFSVAMRYLRAKRQEGFISVIAWFSLLGIGLGVATLIIVMAVMNGFRHELLSRILGLNGHMTITSYTNEFTDYTNIADQILEVPGVVSVMPMIEGQVMASANGTASGSVVRGVTKEGFLNRSQLSDSIISGGLEGFNEGDGVIIGVRMARRMGLNIGDNITLIAPKGQITAFGTVPRMKSYYVQSIFEVGMYEYDNSYVYMPLKQAQIYFNLPDSISAIEVMLTSADNALDMQKPIYDMIGRDYWVRHWQQTNSSFFTALQVERNVMFLILTLIIIVAAFNIISSQIMLVNDKARGIAILRSMGASRNSILRIFFMTGSSVGVIGTIFGSVLGISFASNIETIRQWIESLSNTNLFQAEIYFLSQLPARIEQGEVVTVIVMALALSFVASIYPAWRAARLDPVEVLRYE
ncbi:lipoprotein-releasing ABC transporter permease subunit [Curvivirga sp.]|uniref:lipoprotein-releasing ABC transporter permease subunit n=1 Tax=Curvivirga sp. TaxID=2856848 RepID=UPI003B5B86D4